jgi:hypothetical protein
MHVWAGQPVDFSDLAGRPRTTEVLRTATNRIMAGIVVLMEQIRGETAPPVRFDPRSAHVPMTGNPARTTRDGEEER